MLQTYGSRSLSRRGPDSPMYAAREAIQADNTIVGLVGGIEGFDLLTAEPAGPAPFGRARVEARVLGTRDSGRMIAHLALDDGSWVVLEATFTLSDGTTIPVAGSAGR